jgi:hypothetical protein
MFFNFKMKDVECGKREDRTLFQRTIRLADNNRYVVISVNDNRIVLGKLVRTHVLVRNRNLET